MTKQGFSYLHGDSFSGPAQVHIAGLHHCEAILLKWERDEHPLPLKKHWEATTAVCSPSGYQGSWFAAVVLESWTDHDWAVSHYMILIIIFANILVFSEGCIFKEEYEVFCCLYLSSNADFKIR